MKKLLVVAAAFFVLFNFISISANAGEGKR